MTGLQSFFDAISNEEYVVLRNFEAFRSELDFEEHPDIDMLCSNPKKIRSILGFVSRGRFPDGIHYKTVIAGKPVAIDLRHIGDGYLDAEWERHILHNRVTDRGLCYVPSEEDYRYSLLYHVLIQKKTIGVDYRKKLEKMFGEQLKSRTREAWIAVLESYMQEHGYYYTWPSYPLGIFNLKDVSKAMIKDSPGRKRIHNWAEYAARMVLRK